VPDYRLSPETPFPGALEDVLNCYIALKNPNMVKNVSCSLNGFIPSVDLRVYIVGDSSGACLSLQLLKLICDLRLEQPAGLVLLSPFLDHGLNSPSWKNNWQYDFMSLDKIGIKWALGLYANGLGISHPLLSPIYYEINNMPPILIQTGDSEVVTDDAIRFTIQARKFNNNTIKLEIYKDMFHFFHTFSYLIQAQHAISRISNFINKNSDFSGNRKGCVKISIIDGVVYEEFSNL
jgi:acetyl esterase/lipase